MEAAWAMSPEVGRRAEKFLLHFRSSSLDALFTPRYSKCQADPIGCM